MKTILSVFVLAGSASVALADDIGWYTVDRVTGAGFKVDESGINDRVQGDRYRNFANPPSVLLANFATGVNTRNGDDIAMVAPGAGLLSDFGFSVSNLNANANQSLTFVRTTIEFFDAGGNNLGGFFSDLNMVAILGGTGLGGAGAGVRLNYGAGALTGLNLYIPNAAFVTQTFSGAVWLNGGTDNNIGQQIRNPPAVGTSANGIIINGSYVSNPFGASGPVANMSYFIQTDNIPAPSALALLGLGGLVAGRRRR